LFIQGGLVFLTGEETTLSQIQRLVAEALSAQLTPPGSAGSGHPS
jgi:hypothetical protein